MQKLKVEDNSVFLNVILFSFKIFLHSMLCCFALTVIACCTLVYPSWWHRMAYCCDTYHTPFHCLFHGCIYASPSHVLLPWFPTESAHDARRSTYHCVCSNNTRHQRSLRCNSYKQSGLAIYFMKIIAVYW